MDCSTLGLPNPHHLPEFAQVHIYCIAEPVSSSEALFSHPQSFPASGIFPVSCPFASDDQNTEAEASVFWSSNANRRLIGKVPSAGKDRGQKEKRASEDKMTGRHHQCNGHELGETPGGGEGQGGQGCCSPWSHKESEATRGLSNNSRLLGQRGLSGCPA